MQVPFADKAGAGAEAPAAYSVPRSARAALAFAWSRDGGRTFDEAKIAADSICECCRLGTAFTAPGQP